jgi:hypothetical protein
LARLGITNSALAALALVTACASPLPTETPRAAKAAPSELDRVVYELGGCRGFCPSYSFAISADGNARFEGRRHTKVTGSAPVDTTPSDFREIANALAPARPAGGRTVSATSCKDYITDQQEVTVSWIRGGEMVDKLTFDLGCRDVAEQPTRAALSAARRVFPVDAMIGRPTEY